ncbi:hypothetical protein GJ744_004142 [Endocarpon pusillum]|uniref:Uncharacterized protein n=1 Tax=Endocarpon pusillum TaxID=364733 RepID=A0A8H7E5T9_9EURO|nr:hypothetical protein GJ744_004142 [Endocarpon pusillum]
MDLLISSNWGKAQKFAPIVKFAFTVLREACWKHNFFDNNMVRAKMLRDLAREYEGAPKKKELALPVQDWMARQGFVSEESLAELEKMAGSLTYGALLILRCKYLGRSATKRQHSDKTRKELVRTRSRSGWRKLDHNLLENVRQLWGKYKPGPRISDISFPEITASADRASHDLDEFELHDSELRPEEPNCSETTLTQIYLRSNEDQLEIAEVNVESAHVISKRSSKTRGWENILKLRRNVVGKRMFNCVAVSFVKEIASQNRDS